MDGSARPLAVGEDLYSVLGVPSDASPDAIRQAYRQQARSWHPDVAGSTEAAERFRRLAAAYEVLGDDGARRTYDRRRASTARIDAGGSGPAPIHRAPGPSGNAAVRGPAAQAARTRPSTRDLGPPRPERTSADEWRLATTVGKVLAVIALIMVIAFGTMVVVTATSESDPLPAPTIYCKTPDGWLDCRQAMEPR
ncbi:MAG TPA: J domain-containing protein [Actinomycetota bacterium]